MFGPPQKNKNKKKKQNRKEREQKSRTAQRKAIFGSGSTNRDPTWNGKWNQGLKFLAVLTWFCFGFLFRAQKGYPSKRTPAGV